MYDSGPSRSSPHLIEHHTPTPLFHPKPVSFARPAFTSSYSSPTFSTSSVSPPSPPPPGQMSSSASCSPSPPAPHLCKPSHNLSSKHRKMPKKTSSTTTSKVKSVQVSLEVKVERSRGFHAFFVPLARGMPPAPPSSPVFGQSSNFGEPADMHHKSPSEERWVEDVGQHRMDVDA